MTWLILWIVLFFILAGMRIPIALAMGIAATVVMLFTGIPQTLLASVSFGAIDQFPFLAIPFFLYAGDLMVRGGIAASIIRFTESIIGRFRGSLGATTIVASMMFGTVSGSSVATVSAIGTVMMPELLRGGYDRRYVTALVAASGFLGILIPPSVPGIIFALSAGLSVADVWISTIGAGILVGIGYIILNYFMVRETDRDHNMNPFHFDRYVKEIGHSFREAIWGLCMPLIIFGGVYGGVFTPTEAGAIACGYGIILLFIFKGGEGGIFKKYLFLTRDTAVSSAAICIIIAFAMIVGRMVVILRIPEDLINFITAYTTSPVIFLIFVNIILLIMGTFMETNTSILITAPILIPVAQSFGVNPLHFGAIMLLNLEMGMITPPFAGNLFVACRIGNIAMDKMLKPLGLFFIVLIPILLIITYVPSISLFLVNLLSR